MSDITLGKIILLDDDNADRDAIHVAVAPVIAAEEIFPGSHIGPLDNGTFSREAIKLIGIADPYLTENIKKGERFWLCLYPKTVKNLRHDWEHPAFNVSEEKKTSEYYLRTMADRTGYSFKEL